MLKKILLLMATIFATHAYSDELISYDYDGIVNQFKKVMHSNMSVNIKEFKLNNNNVKRFSMDEIQSGMYSQVKFDNDNTECDIYIIDSKKSKVNYMLNVGINKDFMILHEVSHCYQAELVMKNKMGILLKGLPSEVWADSLSLLILEDDEVRQKVMRVRENLSRVSPIHITSKYIKDINLFSKNKNNEALNAVKMSMMLNY